ncbi:MAG TPA: recombinase family protein, partial [Aquaticitalea sp.]|nr:recombinase family protein [Aquaticitalea sp.]
MKSIKYYRYVRKSTDDDDKQVMSIDAQLAELDIFANREGLKIHKTFTESKSAKRVGREIFNQMIEEIYASKEPIGIIGWHPDRLARNSVDGGQIIYLIDIGKICALKFPTFWFEPTPQGLFMLQVAFGQSKYYSDNLSENVKRGIRQKLRTGKYYGTVPLGYIYNHKTRNINPHEVKGKIIKKAYEEFAEGKHSLRTLSARLSFWGVVNKKGNNLGISAVHRILTNPTYTGIIVWNGESFEGNYEPLVSRATFEAVQKMIHQKSRPRKSKHKHDFPFTGL